MFPGQKLRSFPPLRIVTRFCLVTAVEIADTIIDKSKHFRSVVNTRLTWH